MSGLVEQIVEAQDPIFANWRSIRRRRPFRVACTNIAGIGGCGGLATPILAIRRAVRVARMADRRRPSLAGLVSDRQPGGPN